MPVNLDLQHRLLQLHHDTAPADAWCLPLLVAIAAVAVDVISLDLVDEALAVGNTHPVFCRVTLQNARAELTEAPGTVTEVA